ncbi:patatin-like phospholipase family protein [bacterium]|nr:patatin-like phospholipase family protein [bacterium]
MPKPSSSLGLVLSGGGARGAYEAGVLYYIRTQLDKQLPKPVNFDVLCGSSVGAINSIYMAATAENPAFQGKMLHQLWKDLKQENVYCRNLKAMGTLVGKTVKNITHNLLGVTQNKLEHKLGSLSHFKGILDTSPLKPYINKLVDFRSIGKNIKNGHLSAISLTATNVSTGRMELFIQKRSNLRYTGEYPHQLTELAAEHALASAAIPIIFPPVQVRGTYYTDGGLKLNTPMSPAIQLGANKILIVGLHHRYQAGETIPTLVPPNQYPSLGQLVGQVMNALFVDRIQYDIEQLTRINRIVEWSEKVYGKNYIDKINSMLLREGIKGDVANRGLKKLKVFELSPSHDISEIFSEWFQHRSEQDKSFTFFEKILLRALDIDPIAGVDILSYLAFVPGYIKLLLELGYQDAKVHKEELIEFLAD